MSRKEVRVQDCSTAGCAALIFSPAWPGLVINDSFCWSELSTDMRGEEGGRWLGGGGKGGHRRLYSVTVLTVQPRDGGGWWVVANNIGQSAAPTYTDTQIFRYPIYNRKITVFHSNLIFHNLYSS